MTVPREVAAQRTQDVDKEVSSDAEPHRHRDRGSNDSHEPDNDVEEVVTLGLWRSRK